VVCFTRGFNTCLVFCVCYVRIGVPYGKGYGSSVANALALELGVHAADAEATATIVNATVANLAPRDGYADAHFDVGIVGMKYLLPALSLAGRADAALAGATSSEYPSYG